MPHCSAKRIKTRTNRHVGLDALTRDSIDEITAILKGIRS